jgi:cytochrome c
MDDRFNTIAGWVLFAGIIGLGSALVAGEAFHSGRPETMGYPIEGVQVEAGESAEAEQPIAFYLASANAARGEQVFKKCTACHNADKGGPNALGPNLWNTLGAPIGQGRGFAFSEALSSKGGSWTWDTQSEWLKSPKAFAPGTKMTFAGLSNPQDRADVILFLNQHSDSPQPLPPAPAPTAEPEAEPAADDEQPPAEPPSPEADPKGGGEAAPQD